MKRALFAIAWAAFVLVATHYTTARAHDWYTGTKDPVSGYSCCGGYDCAEVLDTDVRAIQGGYIYIPTSEFIENKRTQPARDWKYHRCEFVGGAQAGETRCFFVPGKSM